MQAVQCLLQLLETLQSAGILFRVGLVRRLRWIEHAHGLRRGTRLQRLLLDHVLSDRKQISLRRADGLRIRHAKHPQVHLLDEIRHVRHVSHAREQEPAQLQPVTRHKPRDQGLSVGTRQASLLR